MADWNKLRGFKRLLHDGVREGASFVEKHHRHAANKPFDVLEAIPPVALPTKVVRAIHDGVVTAVYTTIRGVNDITERVDDWVVDQLEAADADATHELPTSAEPDAGDGEPTSGRE